MEINSKENFIELKSVNLSGTKEPVLMERDVNFSIQNYKIQQRNFQEHGGLLFKCRLINQVLQVANFQDYLNQNEQQTTLHYDIYFYIIFPFLFSKISINRPKFDFFYKFQFLIQKMIVNNQSFINQSQKLKVKKIEMGCAGSKQKDPYTVLVDKCGKDKINQLVVSISKVQYIESSKQQIKNIFKKNITALKLQVLTQIDNQKLQIDKKYQQSISRIQQADPKAIQKAEKVLQNKIQRIMGYTDAINKIAEFKENCKFNLQKQQANAMSFCNNTVEQYLEQLKQNVPSVKKFDNLDDEDQQKILKKAKSKSKSKVQKGIQEAQRQVFQRIKIESFEPKIRSYVTKQKLKELENIAERNFFGGQQKVKGASDCRTC